MEILWIDNFTEYGTGYDGYVALNRHYDYRYAIQDNIHLREIILRRHPTSPLLYCGYLRHGAGFFADHLCMTKNTGNGTPRMGFTLKDWRNATPSGWDLTYAYEIKGWGGVVSFGFGPDDKLRVVKGGGGGTRFNNLPALGETEANAIPNGRWITLEGYVDFDKGAVKVWVDGTLLLDLDELDLTEEETPTASTWQLHWHRFTSNNTNSMTDLVLWTVDEGEDPTSIHDLSVIPLTADNEGDYQTLGEELLEATYLPIVPLNTIESVRLGYQALTAGHGSGEIALDVKDGTGDVLTYPTTVSGVRPLSQTHFLPGVAPPYVTTVKQEESNDD